MRSESTEKIGDRVFDRLPAGTDHGHPERHSRFILRRREIFAAEKAVEHGLSNGWQEGAQIIDVGGESTRPGAEPVAAEEELRRVIPVIEKLRAKIDAVISIDTSKAQVARAAVQAGASIVNDVTGGRGDAGMMPLVAETKSAFIIMHMQEILGRCRSNRDMPMLFRKLADFSTTICARHSV